MTGKGGMKTMKTDPVSDKAFYIVGWILTAMALAVYLAVRLGAFDMLGGLLPCLLHSTTGLYCPGCGGTRAVKALLAGHLLLSMYYHPFVAYTVFVGGWFMISQTIQRVSRGRFPVGMHYRDIYLWLALAVVLVNCLVKNLVLLLWGVALME